MRGIEGVEQFRSLQSKHFHPSTFLMSSSISVNSEAIVVNKMALLQHYRSTCNFRAFLNFQIRDLVSYLLAATYTIDA